jgi:hypothetical protein
MSVTVSIYQVPNQSSFIGQNRDLQVLIARGRGKQFVESVGELTNLLVLKQLHAPSA